MGCDIYGSDDCREGYISRGARQYLREVFGYDKVEDIDPITWRCFADNVRDNPGHWNFDVEIWEAGREKGLVPFKALQMAGLMED